MQEIYCSRCKTTTGPFLKYSKPGKKQYYWCRECKRKQLFLYRQTERGKETTKLAVKKSINKFKEKQNSRRRLNYFLKMGKIVKDSTCSDCLLPKKLAAHHPDYSKPFEVIWLCRGCHADLHRLLNNQSVILLKERDNITFLSSN